MALRSSIEVPRASDMLESARLFFEPQLAKIGLSEAQIYEQTLAELEQSLERVNEAIAHPESFGSIKLRYTSTAAVIITSSNQEAHVEVGALPILLERKSLILRRISTLRQKEQLSDLKEAVASKVSDPRERDSLIETIEESVTAHVTL